MLKRAKAPKQPFAMTGVPLLAMGCAFAAVGASGQTAFSYVAAGLLIPGTVLLAMGLWNRRRQC
ncbi:hypothetical protein DCO48_13550 [Pseudomonas sp. SDI]|uniref:hypothetical protein n=1 Tax=Pseudomonas sp. SDI TaxID=2170734 RepID=UPI000DE6F064|nr:hypothetical protein [Pseudomonas sp. SDI]PWB32359.1 hypothetical protein DCO48_13550 [Pseudomonas sp. SDI]